MCSYRVTKKFIYIIILRLRSAHLTSQSVRVPLRTRHRRKPRERESLGRSCVLLVLFLVLVMPLVEVDVENNETSSAETRHQKPETNVDQQHELCDNYSGDVTRLSHSPLVVRESERTNAAVAHGICVKYVEVMSAPHGHHSSIATCHQVLPVATHHQTLQASHTKTYTTNLNNIFSVKR